jgi:hypothetical protein
VQFTVENRTGGAHQTTLTLAGLPDGNYAVVVDGKTGPIVPGGSAARKIVLSIGPGATTDVTISRR